MKLTKEQQVELAQHLSLPWGSVELLCDGRRITLEVRRTGKGISYRVFMFIDGVFKYAWAQGKTPVPEQKYLRKSVRPILSPAKRVELEKVLGKRRLAKDPYWSGSVTLYLPDWSSGKAAISHLCKACDSVEIAPAKTELAPA